MKKKSFLSGIGAKLALAAVALTTVVFTSCVFTTNYSSIFYKQ